MDYLLLIIGFAFLLYSGKFLVKGSVEIANRFNISKLVIGVTVVSFGTSAPELFVSTIASYSGHPEVAIGNVIGSNIANIALVLAITAIIFPIPVKSTSVKLDAPFMIGVSLLFYFLIQNGSLGRLEGVLFLLTLAAYVLFVIYNSRKHGMKEELPEGHKHMALWLPILMVLGSSAGLAFGSHLLVQSASSIALSLGISERVVAITLVAFGTSLPELATSAIAAFRKEMDISIGNIIGSNIFNLLAVLGVAATLLPIEVQESFAKVDVYWMLGISMLLFLFILPFKGGVLNRFKASVLFLVYCVYVFFLFKG